MIFLIARGVAKQKQRRFGASALAPGTKKSQAQREGGTPGRATTTRKYRKYGHTCHFFATFCNAASCNWPASSPLCSIKNKSLHESPSHETYKRICVNFFLKERVRAPAGNETWARSRRSCVLSREMVIFDLFCFRWPTSAASQANDRAGPISVPRSIHRMRKLLIAAGMLRVTYNKKGTTCGHGSDSRNGSDSVRNEGSS